MVGSSVISTGTLRRKRIVLIHFAMYRRRVSVFGLLLFIGEWRLKGSNAGV